MDGVKNFYRHYRLPFHYKHGFRKQGLSLEPRGGVTLYVRAELREWAVPVTNLPEIYALSVGFAVCSLCDNYCRAAGRVIAKVRQHAGLTGARKPDVHFYGWYPNARGADIESILQRQAEALAGFVYRKRTRLIRSGAPVTMLRALSR